MAVFNIDFPKNKKLPIIVNVPHAGTLIPSQIQDQFIPGSLDFIDDTDWYIDELYSFVTGLGITLMRANYSRWVVDLNRFPENSNMYQDGRLITSLVPITDFKNKPLYAVVPNSDEIDRRAAAYYIPYHQMLSDLIAQYKKEYGYVILFDAHSIRNIVPLIHAEPFPEFIVGDNDGRSCSKQISNIALQFLRKSGRETMHNTLFKGGYITRNYGQPANHIHALQLEMTKTNYMDDQQIEYDGKRAHTTQQILLPMFEQLISLTNSHEDFSI